METVEAAWVSMIQKRIADLERDRDEDRKRLDEAHREIERLTRPEQPLRLNTGGDQTMFSDGHRLVMCFQGDYTYSVNLMRYASERVLGQCPFVLCADPDASNL